MTKFESPDVIKLHAPSAVVATVPYLLGFTPANSLVLLLSQSATGTTQGRVVLTIRFELPDETVSVTSVGYEVARRALQASADAAVAVIYCEAGEQPPPKQWRLLVAAVGMALAGIDVHLTDALFVADRRWWSYLCIDKECCPADGNPVDDAAGCAAAAEAVWHGLAVAPSREDLVSTFAQVSTVRQLETGAEIRRVDLSEPTNFDEWRDSAEADVISLLTCAVPESGVRIAPNQAARILQALAEFRVRDPIMWFLANQASPAELRAAQLTFLDLVAAAPDEFVPAVATLLAIVCWQLGNGTQAQLALARIPDTGPEYTLATLVGRALDAGMPPGEWVQMMHGLEVEGCRTGVAPRRQPAHQIPPAA